MPRLTPKRLDNSVFVRPWSRVRVVSQQHPRAPLVHRTAPSMWVRHHGGVGQMTGPRLRNFRRSRMCNSRLPPTARAVLRVASRVVRHGRWLTFVIVQQAAPDWLRLWGQARDARLGTRLMLSAPFRSAPRERRPTGRTGSVNPLGTPREPSQAVHRGQFIPDRAVPADHEPQPRSPRSPIRIATPLGTSIQPTRGPRREKSGLS